MDRYGKGLIASAGPYQGDSCSDVIVTVSVPEGQYGKLSWTVGQGDGVSERVDITLEGKALVEEMSACLANEADHNLKVTGHINAGSAFDRFTAKVKQSDYDNAEIHVYGLGFRVPSRLCSLRPPRRIPGTRSADWTALRRSASGPQSSPPDRSARLSR